MRVTGRHLRKSPSRVRAYKGHNSDLNRFPNGRNTQKSDRTHPRFRAGLTAAPVLSLKSEASGKGGRNVLEIGNRREQFPYVAPRPFFHRRPVRGLRRLLQVTRTVARPILRDGTPAGFRFDGGMCARVHGIVKGEGFPFFQPGALLRASYMTGFARTPVARVATVERPLLKTIPDMQTENNDLDREIAELLASMKSAEKSFNCKSWDPSVVMPKKTAKETVPTDVPETDDSAYP